MDSAAGLIYSAPLIPSWLSHREDANRLFGTDPLVQLCWLLLALSQEHLTDSETNKQLAATRWDDAHSLHGETNNSLCCVETRRHKQLPSLLVDPTRMLKLKWFNNLQGSN